MPSDITEAITSGAKALPNVGHELNLESIICCEKVSSKPISAGHLLNL